MLEKLSCDAVEPDQLARLHDYPLVVRPLPIYHGSVLNMPTVVKIVSDQITLLIAEMKSAAAN